MPRALSQEQACALLNDIRERHENTRYLAARSADALADRFGVSRGTIYACGRMKPARMGHKDYVAILRARQEYRDARETMLRLSDLAKKHGVAEKTVCMYQAYYHNQRFRDK